MGEESSIIDAQARVLIVCTGNICRSPFIERLLQAQLDQQLPGPGRQILVRSAGTGALVGSEMDPQSAAQLVAHGGDPAGFRARDLTPELIAESDLVLTATRAHRGKVAMMSPKALRRVFTFRDFADLVDGIVLTATPGGQRGWVRHVTERAAASRGLKPPLAPDLADIVDPFRRRDDVFATMARQVVESMPPVVRALAG
jgi:protein-tyrosine phosphatase